MLDLKLSQQTFLNTFSDWFNKWFNNHFDQSAGSSHGVNLDVIVLTLFAPKFTADDDTLFFS